LKRHKASQYLHEVWWQEVDVEHQSDRVHREEARKAHNADFVRRLLARRPQAKGRVDQLVKESIPASAVATAALESAVQGISSHPAIEVALETIVREERPVLFVKNDWIDVADATIIGEEAKTLVADLDAKRSTMQALMPLVGRVDIEGFPGNDFLGTGWFVADDVVVTNRHVALLFARQDGRRFVFARGVAGRPMEPSLSTLHEFDDLAVDQARVFAITDILYIEPEPGPDIAFLRVARRTDGAGRRFLEVTKDDVGDNIPVFTVGYPAKAPKSVISDQDQMKRLYRNRYDVKRAAPGYTMSPGGGATRHDCTTLGGASGSPLISLAAGEVVGMHFAGLYHETNYAVRASVLNDYIKTKRWDRPAIVETRPVRPLTTPPPASPPPPQTVAPSSKPAALQSTGEHGRAVTVTLPLSITVSLGEPYASAAPRIDVAACAHAAELDPKDAEAATEAFWRQRPEGVIAARVGFNDDGTRIGDTPFIAASVPGNQLAHVESQGPATFRGFEVRYLPADVAEQIENSPIVESVDSINYDDDARTGKDFSFDPVEEQMMVRVHVGPEYSWDVLHEFLSGAQTSMVSAMYEFHAPQIKDAIEERLKAGVSFALVLDNATFSKVVDKTEEFDRIAVFEAWERKFHGKFNRIVAPEGLSGLISDSYHIKVTVREDDTFWLSSGNWKKGSSQPVITQEQRDEAEQVDLPGNREWHVVIKSPTLAKRFRNHIQQDFKRSQELGGGKLPRSKEAVDILVDIPIEEAVVEERRPPSKLLKPREFKREVRVKPLLTPDKEGAIYSEAVLELIRSAKKSLLFQIPYIGMPSAPGVDRGYIDELIKALTQKLKTLEDARLILRVGSSKFSAPTHSAWFFKSKGVDIDARLKQIDDHHTKGMIVDGKRVLIGSHNWSKPGVTLNRDASLIFDDAEIAAYYAEAFEIDWKRANTIKPKKFVKKPKDESVILDAVGAAPPPGFKRMRLSELMKNEDD
jgi:phosphatidylserine/phosphatidylglycerophosphate/cardiolipin synthase-like enzyme